MRRCKDTYMTIMLIVYLGIWLASCNNMLIRHSRRAFGQGCDVYKRVGAKFQTIASTCSYDTLKRKCYYYSSTSSVECTCPVI